MKNLLFLVVLLLLPLTVRSQGIGFGLKAGANFAGQAVKEISVKTAADFHIGAYANVNLSGKIGVSPEILYSAYGSDWEGQRADFDYISIPVMFRYKPVSLLSLEVGPQFSFLTKAVVENEGDVKSYLKNSDFGLAFGAGVHLPLGFNAGARYVIGLSDISKASSQSIKNRDLQIYVGWTFFGAK